MPTQPIKFPADAPIEEILQAWKSSLCPSVELAALYQRNPTAHKWKAPFRSLILREGLCWRLCELLESSTELSKGGKILGARLLLRAAFETLAVLIYLNQLMRAVVLGNQEFNEFAERTVKLLLGSRREHAKHESLNVLTILQKAENRYPGIIGLYSALCESAHPNQEGVLIGFSSFCSEDFITTFSNRWPTLYGEEQEELTRLCMQTFEMEYNDEFTAAFESLEFWMTENDVIISENAPVKPAQQ